jgi:adenine-specific DNA-methyltransferase
MNSPLATAALIEETDRVRLTASSELDQDRRSDMGQFMTPGATARLMAAMFSPLPAEVRLLDAGAGAGSLTAAFVAEACYRAKRPARIAATAFELDAVLAADHRDRHQSGRTIGTGISLLASRPPPP